MEDKIHLVVLTPEGKVLDKKVNYANVPADNGPVGILPGHLPMICAAERGDMLYRWGENQTAEIRLWDSVAGFTDNELVILASKVGE